jgi:hypothetical protein
MTTGDSIEPQPKVDLPRPNFIRSLIARWNAAMEMIAPMGYEDDQGFHFGPEPVALRMNGR